MRYFYYITDDDISILVKANSYTEADNKIQKSKYWQHCKVMGHEIGAGIVPCIKFDVYL